LVWSKKQNGNVNSSVLLLAVYNCLSIYSIISDLIPMIYKKRVL